MNSIEYLQVTYCYLAKLFEKRLYYAKFTFLYALKKGLSAQGLNPQTTTGFHASFERSVRLERLLIRWKQFYASLDGSVR